ncbi:Rieske 2Fe-2S domain-containing protein [Actinoplanes sp. DH11]|uniref:Rieske 2Fe-2S domain-containing protein n=1 Tax=Actinoplanes sp. DH11 TaxID=2857011 RepID=UPI001E41FD00|nr:Rieske 2Fe-2S domain-containing protein [Actinoplanes sp. DH11]
MLRQAITRLEQAEALDGASDKMQAVVSAAIRPRLLRDLLHGTKSGHPVHPVLVQVPLGAFLSAAVLDAIPGMQKAATTLIGFGTASVLPAAIAGWVDWSEMTKDRRRVGLVHATTNVVATALYASSLVARLTGHPTRGKALAYAGLSVAGAGGYLGGHLAYAQGGGISHAATEVALVPEEWTEVTSLSSLPDGKPAVRKAGDVPVLLYRQGDRVTALIERCSHEAGPLGEGEVVGSGSSACVVCPWHGSTFRLSDGLAVHGPAGNDQPVLPVRIVGGAVQVRRP